MEIYGHFTQSDWAKNSENTDFAYAYEYQYNDGQRKR